MFYSSVRSHPYQLCTISLHTADRKSHFLVFRIYRHWMISSNVAQASDHRQCAGSSGFRVRLVLLLKLHVQQTPQGVFKLLKLYKFILWICVESILWPYRTFNHLSFVGIVVTCTKHSFMLLSNGQNACWLVRANSDFVLPDESVRSPWKLFVFETCHPESCFLYNICIGVQHPNKVSINWEKKVTMHTGSAAGIITENSQIKSRSNQYFFQN